MWKKTIQLFHLYVKRTKESNFALPPAQKNLQHSPI